MYVCMYFIYIYIYYKGRMYVYIYIHTHTHTHTYTYAWQGDVAFDAVEKDEDDGRETISLVVVGHVDAGMHTYIHTYIYI